MFSHLIACTGWTWEYIDDHMTLPRLSAMGKYWKRHPPLHMMVQKFMGIEEEKPLTPEEFFGELGQTGLVTKK